MAKIYSFHNTDPVEYVVVLANEHGDTEVTFGHLLADDATEAQHRAVLMMAAPQAWRVVSIDRERT